MVSMLPLSATLEKALTGLRASQSGIDIVARNLANVNTPGYTRKFQNLQPKTNGGDGFGVEQLAESRYVDKGLEKQFRENFSQNERLKILDNFLSRFEDTFGAPNADINIAYQITKLGDTFRALAEKPDSVTAQNGVIAQAQQVVTVLNNLTTAIQDLRSEADRQIEVSIGNVNNAVTRIDELNGEIGARFAQGLSTGDLEDLRDVEVEKINKEMDITYFTRGNNQLCIFTGGGRALLEGPPQTLSYTSLTTLTAANFYPAGGISGIMLNGNDVTTEFAQGRIGGYRELRDTRFASTVGGSGAQSVIDALSATMTQSFGLPPPLGRGLELFQDSGGVTFAVGNTRGYAGRILVNPVVVANPWRTRDGTIVAAEETNERGDATLPLTIVDLFENTATFTSGIAIGVNTLIGGNVAVRNSLEYQDNLTNALDMRRQNQSGVNTDQELQLMIQLQASYSASARVVQTVKDMYDELLRLA